MQVHLKAINSVLGVSGSFVCTTDGLVLAHLMPKGMDDAALELAARAASQTFEALETAGQRIAEIDLIFEGQRLIVRSLRGGFLAILCSRNISLPLLNLTANVAAKKIAAELKTATGPAPVAPTPVEPAPTVVVSPTTAAVAAPAASMPAPTASTASVTEPVPAEPITSPLFIELKEEIRRLFDEAQRQKIDLRVLDSMGIWLSTSTARSVLAPLDKREIILAGRMSSSDSITHCLEKLGYVARPRSSSFSTTRRLSFDRSAARATTTAVPAAAAGTDLTLDVYLDSFTMYHRLDLTNAFAHEGIAAPESTLLLLRLQLVETSASAIRDIAALLIEHDLSVGSEKGKIDASSITRVCADDWGWFKTATMNLDRVSTFASETLPLEARTLVTERVRRLKQSLDDAPKSLRWQTRARLGESMRWYDTPVIGRPSGRPDMAFG